MNDVKVEKGVSLNKMRALMYYSVWCWVNVSTMQKIHNLLSRRPLEFTDIAQVMNSG
jgi:hypothetical protein